MTDQQDFKTFLGERLAQLRKAQGWTQDAFAQKCREVAGLEWARATVAQIETGERDVSARELLALTRVFDRNVGQILETDRVYPVAIAPGRTVHANHLSMLASGDISNVRIKSLQGTAAVSSDATGRLNVTRRQLQGHDPNEILRDAQRETEQSIARRLKITPEHVALIARRQWEHSLVEERELRFERFGGTSGTASTDRTQRGHITRQLLEELKADPLYLKLRKE
jgi:transcriptional regulator with XRE-family HTH domain